MKKILIMLLFVSGILLAQTWEPTASNNGRYKFMRSGDSTATFVYDVNSSNPAAQLDSIHATNDLLRNSLDSLNIGNNLQRDANTYSVLTNTKLTSLLDSVNVSSNIQRNSLTELQDLNTLTSSTNSLLGSGNSNTTSIDGKLTSTNSLLTTGNVSTNSVDSKLTSTNSLLTTGNVSTNSIDGKLTTTNTNTAIRTTLNNTTGGYGVKSVAITATQLSSSTVPCKKIIISNNTAGGLLYIGYSNAVTSSNFAVKLNYDDSFTCTLDNLTDIWMIGNVVISAPYGYEN